MEQPLFIAITEKEYIGEKMSDYLVKSLAYDGQLRVYAVDTTETVREAQKIHDTWSTATVAFGRAITGTSLLSQSLLKKDNKMTVKIVGDGAIGTIVVDARANGDLKGYLREPHVHLPLNEEHKVDVKSAIGEKGFIEITKDLGLKIPFTGKVPLVSGELGDDFTYYMAKSEQIPSAIGVSVVSTDNLVKAAGGFMIQVLPSISDEVLSIVEKKIAEIPAISVMMANGLTPEKIIYEICGEENTQILEKKAINYRCDCSKKRFGELVSSIPNADMKLLIEQDHGAEIVCQFCKKKYFFDEDELKVLMIDR